MAAMYDHRTCAPTERAYLLSAPANVPRVVDVPAHPVVATSWPRCRSLPRRVDDRQPATDFSWHLRFADAGLLVLEDPDCQRCPSVLELVSAPGRIRTCDTGCRS